MPEVPSSRAARILKEHKVFRTVLIASFLSGIGTWMQLIVLASYAYTVTQSAAFVGRLIFAQLGPILLFGLVGGMAADRFERRRLLLLVTFVQALLAIALSVVTNTDAPSIGALYAITVAMGLSNSFFMPTYGASIPTLVPRPDMRGAISLASAAQNGARVIGPALGGIAYAAMSASAVFAINGLSFLFVIAALLLVRFPPQGEPDRTPLRLRLKVAFQVALTEVVVRKCLVTMSLFSFFCLLFVNQMPVIASINLGVAPDSARYGILYAFFGLGAVTGSILPVTLLASKPNTVIIPRAMVAFGVCLSILAILSGPTFSYPVVFLVGATYLTFVTSITATFQQQLDDGQRGRLTALWGVSYAGIVALSNLAFGPVIDSLGVTVPLLLGGAAAMVLAAYSRTIAHSLGDDHSAVPAT